MKVLGMVQDVADASYDSKKGRVEALGVQVVEIGAAAFRQVLVVQVPKDGNKFKSGDLVEVSLVSFRGVFSNMVKCDGTVVLRKG